MRFKDEFGEVKRCSYRSDDTVRIVIVNSVLTALGPAAVSKHDDFVFINFGMLAFLRVFQ